MYKEKSINWGILGLARIARKRMIEAIQKTGSNIHAIASRDVEKALQLTTQLDLDIDIPVLYDSYDELLDDNKIDAVYIPLPNSMHYSWVIRAAEKGKHILCEKPLGYSTSQVQEMIQICKKRSVLLLEAHSYFLHPRYAALFKLLNEGIIGSVKQIQVHFSFPAREKEHGIRFKYELGDLNRFESVGEMIEAIYRHIHYYNHSRIHTALKMPPAIYAARMFSDTCLHELGT